MMTLWQCTQGLIKGATFGVLVALAGCLRGMQCGRSASAVGEAATSAVVTSIVLIVIADAIWTFIFLTAGGMMSRMMPPAAGEAHVRVHDLTWPMVIFVIQRDLTFDDQSRRHLHYYGRQRVREEHPAQAPDRPGGARRRHDPLRRYRFLGQQPTTTGRPS